MQLPVFNITMIMSVGLIIGAMYGVVAGKQRLRILILSIYVGTVLSSQLVEPLAPFTRMLTREQLGWALFGLPILVFGFFGVMHAKNHSKGAFIANVIVGILTAGLIMSTVMNLLPISVQAQLHRDSFLALNLDQFHPWLLGLLPLIALLLGFMKTEKGH